MARGRKQGCPVNIRDWLISILEPGMDAEMEENWVRIYGLTSLTDTTEGETEDGSSDSDVWSEPYITKRSAKLDLEGDKKIVAATGVMDHGQELLDYYAAQSGCESDATIRFIDPYGHGKIANYVITSAEDSADDSGNSRSWSLEQVGESDQIPYVQLTEVKTKIDSTESTELSMQVGDAPKLVELAITPENASNKRFRVSSNRPSTVARVADVTESGFSIVPIGEGSASITVTTVNNAKKATIAVTVTAADP